MKHGVMEFNSMAQCQGEIWIRSKSYRSPGFIHGFLCIFLVGTCENDGSGMGLGREWVMGAENKHQKIIYKKIVA